MEQNKRKKKFQDTICARAVRHGLTLAIPFLMLGSFALLFNNFPIELYQNFLASFFDGALSRLFVTLYNISLGSLSMVLCFTISLSYGRLAEESDFLLYPITAITAYLAFCGGGSGLEGTIFGAEWVFTAMCVTLLSCCLFQKFSRLSRRFERLHTMGAEYLFNVAIQSLLPVVVIILLFAGMGYLLRAVWGNNNITNFGSYLFLHLFDKISGNLFGILLYVFLTHVLWFFGIHGTNTLEAVSQRLFEQGVETNQALLLAGKIPTEIFSKTFLDTFVFLGGCGSALCLVAALCLTAKKSHNRKLAHVALPAALFNISEMVVFGFPIIFNFTMLVPFLLTPLVLTLTSTLAMTLGLVPVVTQSVGWTVPILFSGYKATGSIAGSILQLINLAIGVAIYIPFVKRSEKRQTEEFQNAVRHMEQAMQDGEKNGILPRYLHHNYPYNYYAQTLARDLKNAIQRDQVLLFYQAQVSDGGSLHGAEGLLRWKHPVAGYIAPPVLIHLAYESGFLGELGYYLIEKAGMDAERMENVLQGDLYLSINISPKQMESERFLENVRRMIEAHHLEKVHPVLEITERAAMEISDRLADEMQSLRRGGIEFSMDDFGMGHSSMLNLQENLFDEVKLDGKLVTQVLNNDRSRDIIAGIIQMADHLHCRTIAEFVETKEQQEILRNLGCHIYQGYYYSRPLPPDAFLEYAASLLHQDAEQEKVSVR